MPATPRPAPAPDTPVQRLGRPLILCAAGALLILLALARSAWLLALEHYTAGLTLCVLAMVLPLVGLMWLWQHVRLVHEHSLQQQTDLLAALARSERLEGALRCFPDAVALFDAEDRLVLASDRYRSMNPAVAPLLQPGVPFEQILRAAAAAGEVTEAVGNEDNWVRQRIHQHQSLRQDFLQGLAGNRWVRVNECRTPDGGLIGLRTNVTDFVRQQQALQEARSDAQQARRLLVRALDALPAALEIFDEQDRLVIYNRALQNMFPHIDYPRSVGRPFADMAAESLRHHAVVEAVGQQEQPQLFAGVVGRALGAGLRNPHARGLCGGDPAGHDRTGDTARGAGTGPTRRPAGAPVVDGCPGGPARGAGGVRHRRPPAPVQHPVPGDVQRAGPSAATGQALRRTDRVFGGPPAFRTGPAKRRDGGRLGRPAPGLAPPTRCGHAGAHARWTLVPGARAQDRRENDRGRARGRDRTGAQGAATGPCQPVAGHALGHRRPDRPAQPAQL